MGNGGLKSFSGTLSYVAERCPYRRAISVRQGGELPYADLNHSVEKVASSLLSLGVQPGDVVPIVFPDTVESVVSLLAVMRIRAVAAPLLDLVCTEEGFERYLHKYKAKLLLDGPKPNPTARAVANRLDATHWVVSLHDLPDYAADVGAVAGVINDPDDVALLLPTDGEVEQEVTQGRLASLVKSVDRQPSLAAADPLLHRLRRHRHLTSMFLSLADAVKSLTTAGGDVAESGNLTKMFEYGMKQPELSLAFAVPILINLVVNYLPVEQWSKTLAAFLVYMGVTFSLTGVAFNQKLNSCGRWLGVTSFTLGMAGVAVLVLPAFGWWKGMVAGAATLVAAVAPWVVQVWGAPPGQGVHPAHQGGTRKVAAPEQVTLGPRLQSEQEREPRPSPTWCLPGWPGRTKCTGDTCDLVGVVCDSPTKTTPPTGKEP